MFCIESSLAWLEFFDGWLAWFERASGVGVIGFGIYQVAARDLLGIAFLEFPEMV